MKRKIIITWDDVLKTVKMDLGKKGIPIYLLIGVFGSCMMDLGRTLGKMEEELMQKKLKEEKENENNKKT